MTRILWLLMLVLLTSCGGGESDIALAPIIPPPQETPPIVEERPQWLPNTKEQRIIDAVQQAARDLYIELYSYGECDALPDSACRPYIDRNPSIIVWRDFGPGPNGLTARMIGQVGDRCPDSSPYVDIGCLRGVHNRAMNTIWMVRLDDVYAAELTRRAREVDPNAFDFTCFYTYRNFLTVLAHENDHAVGFRFHNNAMAAFDEAVMSRVLLMLNDELAQWDADCPDPQKSSSYADDAFVSLTTDH